MSQKDYLFERSPIDLLQLLFIFDSKLPDSPIWDGIQLDTISTAESEQLGRISRPGGANGSLTSLSGAELEYFFGGHPRHFFLKTKHF